MASGITRGQAILLGLGVLGMGAAGYGIFQATGYEGFSAGIASVHASTEGLLRDAVASVGGFSTASDLGTGAGGGGRTPLLGRNWPTAGSWERAVS